MKSCLIIPYATLDDYNTSVNMPQVHQEKVFDAYLKNLCVAAVSAKKNGCNHRLAGGGKLLINCDISVVTNFNLPTKYKVILENNDIKIFYCPFDDFNFGANYKWSLAFYKLCALKFMVEKYNYDNYAFVDTDVYFQSKLEYIWQEAKDKILLYDINHGLQAPHYKGFVDEVNKFGVNGLITHYGGEFFAAGRENSIKFINKCIAIYEKMIGSGFETTKGDEFITSVAAAEMKDAVKNAGAYVYRFWTGGFRLVSTNYKFNPITVIHVPAEKMNGMLKIFDRYIVKGKLPPNRTVWQLLHLNHQSLRAKLSYLRQRLLN